MTGRRAFAQTHIIVPSCLPDVMPSFLCDPLLQEGVWHCDHECDRMYEQSQSRWRRQEGDKVYRQWMCLAPILRFFQTSLEAWTTRDSLYVTQHQARWIIEHKPCYYRVGLSSSAFATLLFQSTTAVRCEARTMFPHSFLAKSRSLVDPAMWL